MMIQLHIPSKAGLYVVKDIYCSRDHQMAYIATLIPLRDQQITQWTYTQILIHFTDHIMALYSHTSLP